MNQLTKSSSSCNGNNNNNCNDNNNNEHISVMDTDTTGENRGGIGDPANNCSIIVMQNPPSEIVATPAMALNPPSTVNGGGEVEMMVSTTSQTNPVVPRRDTTFTRRHSIDNLSSLDTERKADECSVSSTRMDYEDDHDTKCSPAATTTTAITTMPLPPPPITKTVARICGSWRSKCGYCRGKRLHVLRVSDAFNKSLISTEGQQQQQQQRHSTATAAKDCGESSSTIASSSDEVVDTKLTPQKMTDNNNKTTTATAEVVTSPTAPSFLEPSSPPPPPQQPHIIDENHTSKSYGLIFDNLPYDMYETFVNRGWRRSGKDLYHPHTFESCCPAISIRLDVWKFGAGGCGATANTATKNAQSPSSSAQCAEMGMENSDNCCNKEEDAAWTVTMRGSKRQRKVGRAILRALETYNAKCSVHEEGGARGALCSADSVDDTKEMMMMKKKLKIGCQRQQKKSRQHSPERRVCIDDSMDLEENNVSSALLQEHSSRDPNDDPESKVGTNLSSAATAQTCHPPCLDHQGLRPYLETLSRIVFNVVTTEAKNAVASTQAVGMCDNERTEAQPPRWAWWNDGVPSEEARIPKWCSFKVSQSQARCLCSANATGGGLVVVASTPVCAAVHGLSGGKIGKCRLSLLVLESLKSLQRTSYPEEKDGPRVLEVSVHEKSAHVNVMLEVPSMLVDISVADRDSAPHQTQPIPVSLPTTERRNPSILDPISEFMLRHASISRQLNGTIPHSHPVEECCHPHHQRRYLTVRSIPVHESTLQPEVHQLYCRYQSAIHGDVDPFFGCDVEGANSINVREYYSYRRRYNPPGFLDVDTVYGNFDEGRRAKIKLSYLTFYRFLGETPVTAHHVRNNTSRQSHPEFDICIPYGTYHQQYRLSTSKDSFDGPLIAVGVTDILPHCLSSVYSFYDPILSAKLELGKYTALREIEWVRRASRYRPDLHYYYLGYYIHSCKKMSYKAEFKPSELLCPVYLKWVDFDVGKKRLEECSPIRQCCNLFIPDSGSSNVLGKEEESNSDDNSNFQVEDITLDIGEKEPYLIQVGMLNKQGKEFVGPFIREFAEEVGIDLCHAFIIKVG